MDGQIYNLNKGKSKKNGDKLAKKPFYVRYRIEDPITGKITQKAKKGFADRDEAQRFLNEIQNSIINNRYIAPTDMTLKDLLTEWLEKQVDGKLAQSTVDGYRVNIEKHVIPGIGNILLQKLRVKDIQDFYDRKLEDGCIIRKKSAKVTEEKKGLSSKSIIYIHRNLCKALDYAMKNQLIQKNPAKDVTLPKVRKFTAEVFDHKTVIKFIESLKGDEIEVPVALAGLAGMRRGEALGLLWEDVNFDAKTVTINKQLAVTTKGVTFEYPKTNESVRTIMVTDELISILKRQQVWQQKMKDELGEEYINNNLVCCRYNGEWFNPSNFSKLYSNALTRNGFKHIRFHDLRHSWATYMIRLGVPLNVVSKMLGHKTVGVTMEIYVHVVNEMQQEAIDKLNSVIASIKSGETEDENS